MRKLDFGRLRAAQRDEAGARGAGVAGGGPDRGCGGRCGERRGAGPRGADAVASRRASPYETLRERLTKDGGLDRLREEMRREKTGSVLYEKLAS